MIEIKALACELPYQHELPLSRLSLADIREEAIRRGIVASIGRATIWRWLSEDAIRPWYRRSWIFPRDPDFSKKAGPVLDLYQGIWRKRPLCKGDFVISTDEKTSIQARRRIHPTSPPRPGKAMRVEHEYERKGALAYLAAWDVHRARVYGRCEPTTGIEPFGRLVKHVMRREPYRSARRVFWIMDNGSSHRGQACVDRLQSQWPNIEVVHLPIHASWLNQIEIYFSVVQRKVLTPNDFDSTLDLQHRISKFQRHFTRIATPFEWKFTRSDLRRLCKRLKETWRHAAA